MVAGRQQPVNHSDRELVGRSIATGQCTDPQCDAAALVASACFVAICQSGIARRLRLGMSGGLWVAAAYALIADHFLMEFCWLPVSWHGWFGKV